MLVRLRHDRERGKRTNWLLIKRHDGYEREGDNDGILAEDRSVASGRSMEEIAAGKGRRPKPFMLGKEKSFQANAVWHSNRTGNKATPAITLKPATKPAAKSPRSRGEAVAGSLPSFMPPQLCKRVSRPPIGAGLGSRDQARRLSHAAAGRRTARP